MELEPTRVFRDPWDVETRLTELGLDRKRLLEVARVARSAAADATSFHPVNAAGTFAYQHGTFALRDRFVGEDWTVDRSDAVEAIVNTKLRLKLVFSNVDVACLNDQLPRPRSRKGVGSERACSGNLFGDLPHYSPRPADGLATYYVMVDERGSIELSQPIVRGGEFAAFVERIFIADGEEDGDKLLAIDEEDLADDFDPQVARK